MGNAVGMVTGATGAWKGAVVGTCIVGTVGAVTGGTGVCNGAVVGIDTGVVGAVGIVTGEIGDRKGANVCTGIVGGGTMILDFCVGNEVGMESGAMGVKETGDAIGDWNGDAVPVLLKTSSVGS